MEQCREVYSALVHTVPDLWMRRGFSLCYCKQHPPSILGFLQEQEVPARTGRATARASQEPQSQNLCPGMTKAAITHKSFTGAGNCQRKQLCCPEQEGDH